MPHPHNPESSSLDLVNTGTSIAIVTCHNYGHFLRQCLESILSQTKPYDHVVVVDDASTDDTAEICQEFAARGVMVVSGKWRNFTRARQAGLASLPRSRFITFVDADNWLSPEFHQELRTVMTDPSVGVAYPIKRNVTTEGDFILDWAPKFDHDRLRRDNQVDACALIRTEAYEQVGGLEEVDGLTDWLLWLKISRAGWKFQHGPGAILMYRRHGKNMGDVRGAEAGRHVRAILDVYQKGAIVTIVTLFAGREWMLPRYIQFLKDLKWDRKGLRLVAVDNSRSPEFNRKLREGLDETDIQVTIIKDDERVLEDVAAAELSDEAKLRGANSYALSRHLARLYNRARQEMPSGTDFVWCLEDDIEPPTNALGKMLETLYRHKEAGVVTGCVHNRFGGGKRVIAYQGDWEEFLQLELVAEIPQFIQHGFRLPIMATGFFCSLFRRDVWDKLVLRPSPLWNEKRRPWYDWSAGLDVHRMGEKWMLDGSVHCRHWQRDGTFI